MSVSNLKITFNLDGTGVYYDPFEPIHLDALLAWALAPFHCKGEPPSRDTPPIDIPLPLDKWYLSDTWGWKASALFPDAEAEETIQYWRKKFRQDRVELTKGSPNLKMGVYREYNTPLPLILSRTMTAYAVGDRGRVNQILRKHVKYLGKKRAYGKGRVVSIETEIIDHDYSMIKGGKAMRFLPDENGIRLCRVRPPYWNIVDRVKCCEIGDNWLKP